MYIISKKMLVEFVLPKIKFLKQYINPSLVMDLQLGFN